MVCLQSVNVAVRLNPLYGTSARHTQTCMLWIAVRGNWLSVRVLSGGRKSKGPHLNQAEQGFIDLTHSAKIAQSSLPYVFLGNAHYFRLAGKSPRTSSLRFPELRLRRYRSSGRALLGRRMATSGDLASDLFKGTDKVWMLNFRVRDLDKMAAQLRAAGIAVEIDPQSYPNGRFASLHDPEGNPIQLWQPAKP